MLKEYEMEDLKKVMIILDTFIPPGKEDELSDNLEEGIVLAASFANYFKEGDCEVSFAAYTPDLTFKKTDWEKQNLYDIFLSLAILEPSKNKRVEMIFPEIDRSGLKNSFNIAILLSSDDNRKKNIQTLARDYKISRVIYLSEGKHRKFYSREKSHLGTPH